MRPTALVFAALALSGFVAAVPAPAPKSSGVSKSSPKSTGTNSSSSPKATGGNKSKPLSTGTGKTKPTGSNKPKSTGTGKSSPKSTGTSNPKGNSTSTKGLYGSDMDKPRCYWKSQDSIYVSWVITVPEYKGNKVEAIKGDFVGSIDQNSACRGISPAPGMKEWYAVGASNSTALFSFSSSDFCTAYQMTNVIKDTTGNIQNTACKPFDDAEGGSDPDPSNLVGELPEGGDDGEDGMFKRDSNAPRPSPISDAAMAKLLQMPANSKHSELVDKLKGPSPIDKHQ